MFFNEFFRFFGSFFVGDNVAYGNQSFFGFFRFFFVNFFTSFCACDFVVVFANYAYARFKHLLYFGNFFIDCVKAFFGTLGNYFGKFVNFFLVLGFFSFFVVFFFGESFDNLFRNFICNFVGIEYVFRKHCRSFLCDSVFVNACYGDVIAYAASHLFVVGLFFFRICKSFRNGFCNSVKTVFVDNYVVIAFRLLFHNLFCNGGAYCVVIDFNRFVSGKCVYNLFGYLVGNFVCIEFGQVVGKNCRGFFCNGVFVNACYGNLFAYSCSHFVVVDCFFVFGIFKRFT